MSIKTVVRMTLWVVGPFIAICMSLAHAAKLEPVIPLDTSGNPLALGPIADYALSPEGRRAVFQSGNALYRTHVLTGETQSVSIGVDGNTVDCPHGDICRIRGISLGANQILYGGQSYLLLVDFTNDVVTDVKSLLDMALQGNAFTQREWALSAGAGYVTISGQYSGANDHIGVLTYDLQENVLIGLGANYENSLIFPGSTKEHIRVGPQGRKILLASTGLSQQPFGFYRGVFSLNLDTGEQQLISPEFRGTERITRVSASTDLDRVVYQVADLSASSDTDKFQTWFYDVELQTSSRIDTDLVNSFPEAIAVFASISGNGKYAGFNLLTYQPGPANQIPITYRATIELSTGLNSLIEYDELPPVIAGGVSIEGYSQSYDAYARGLDNMDFFGNRALVLKPSTSVRSDPENQLYITSARDSADSVFPAFRRSRAIVSPLESGNNLLRGAVVLVHGWISPRFNFSSGFSNPGAPDWLDTAGNSLCEIIGGDTDFEQDASAQPQKLCQTETTDVFTLNWEDEAFNASPIDAVDNGVQVGRNLGSNLKSLNYGRVHLVAHSAGSAVIDEAATFLSKENPISEIQLSYLDAFDPHASEVANPEDLPELDDLFLSSYNSSADFVDNYFETRNPGPAGLIETGRKTQNLAKRGFNLDVTAADDNQDPDFSMAHAWPREFYESTFSMNEALPYGFSNGSIAVGNPAANYSISEPEGLCVLIDQAGAQRCIETNLVPKGTSVYLPVTAATTEQTIQSENTRLQPVAQVSTGAAQNNVLVTRRSIIDGGASTEEFKFDTIDVEVILDEPSEAFAFDIDFAQGSDAMVSVYVSDSLLTRIDLLDYPASETVNTGPIFLPAELGQSFTVTIRLDYPSTDLTPLALGGFRGLNARELISRTIAPNIWQQLSFPASGRADMSIRNVMSSGIDPDDFGNTWVLFDYDAATGLYSAVDLESPFDPLTAYWFIHDTDESVTLSVPDVPLLGEGISSARCPDTSCIETEVVGTSLSSVTWHQLGTAEIDDTMDLSRLKVYFESGSCNSGCSLSESAANGLTSPSLFVYKEDQTGYQTLAAQDSINSWKGGWLGVVLESGEKMTVTYDY